MKITRRKGPLIVVCSILIIVPTFLSFSHYVQLALMKHIPLKEFIIKSIVANQNLNISDSMYVSFFNRSGNTMDAIDTLDALNALTEINKDAVLTFLIGPNQTGPLDDTILPGSHYNIFPAFVIVHTASILGKINALPKPLIDRIVETIADYQNASFFKRNLQRYERPYLFETARLLNVKQYVNLTFQRQDILRFIEERCERRPSMRSVFEDAKALEELNLMENGQTSADLPEMAQDFFVYYILSLWDDSQYGFYENFNEYRPEYHGATLQSTFYAVQAYEKIYGTNLNLLGDEYAPQHEPFMRKAGDQYEKLLAFLKKRRNRYGLFFDYSENVHDSIRSLQIYPTHSAVILLKTIGRLDFLNQIVRWPAQPTFIESIQDSFP